MLLAIDSGNTNVVYAVFDESGKLRGTWRASNSEDKTADEIGVWLTQLMQHKDINPKKIKASIIASVVPRMLFDLQELCRRYFNCEPHVVSADEGVACLGFKILVERPDEVGADRLVNAVSANERYGGPLIIIDFGTATTFDVLDEDGNYIGGSIAPGINLSLEALNKAAAKLPRIAVGKPNRVIGTDTISAMQSGTFWGYIGLIEGMVSRIQQECGIEMKVVATGGLAPLFAGSTDIIDHLDEDLTLRGLFEIHTNLI
ncbi:MAG: type III pantothenate kinase [Alphaproteobacteria bacterium]|nr:type III pantothenate kinase [Alphaproteobacteria bacterium]